MSRSRNAYEAPSDAPVVNPFDRFTQGDFDDYVGGLRSKIRDALDPRRGLRNRDRDSDASFGLGYGEFRFGRSVSVGETSFAASGQSVPRSSVEGELGERRVQYQDQGDDPESDQEEGNQSPSKPTVVVSGAGDEESPFVISDDEDEEETPAPAAGSDVLTPRTEARQLLGLQDYGDDEQSEEEGSEEEEEDEITSSPLHAPPKAGPMNIYDDIDDVQLVEDSSVEEDAGENTENNAFAEPENTFEGSSPAWLAEPDAEEDVSDGGHAQDSTHSFDEYFVADLPSELATSYTYDPSEPEMREISGNTLNPFSQMLPPDPVTGSSFFPTQDSNALPWLQEAFSNGDVENARQGGIPAGLISQASTSRDDSRRISWPALSGFGGGGVNIFDAVGYAPQAMPPSSEPSFYFDVPEDAASSSPQDLANMSRSTSIVEVFDEQLPTTQEAAQPDAVEELKEDTVPQLSEDVGSIATLSFTPPLSPSGITLTAQDPSLLSDGSSVATSVPVALEPPLDAGPRIGSAEFINDVEDWTLPEEVAQGLNRNVNRLPDPHQVPEPTSLGIPEGVAGLATRIVEPSVWAEPPTPFRSENADDAVSHLEADYSSDEPETSIPPPRREPVVEPPPVSRNPSRVRWRDHYPSDDPSFETPREELETLEHVLLQATPLTESSETPREELSLLESSLVASTPVETPREELDTLARRLVFPTPTTETPLETPLDELQTLDQFLLTGGSTGDTPLRERGNLTRESTMTEAAWSQGFPNSSPLRHATSATLTGESYFPSQPISSPGRQISQAATQETLDASSDVDQSVARSVSPFSDGSPLSEDRQTPSTSMQKRRTKRASHPTRVSSSVGTVSKRELKALQDVGTVLKGPRLRHSQSKPIVQTNTSPARAKGKQKSSSPSKKELPKIVTSTRVRALRSNSQASSAVSKQRSPTSTADHGDGSDESSRDEIDLLERVNEERREREEDDMNGSEHSDLHPRNKRKRVPRISMPGDDEDYLPDDVERSLKKRKVEAKEHDLDHSLDAIDLASALEMAETIAADARPAKKSKPKKKKKGKQTLAEEPVEAASSPEDSNDHASEFVPSPKDEKAPESLLGVPELEAEAYDQLSPAAQTRFRRLDPGLRAYVPPEDESESEEEEVSQAALIRDLETLVDDVDASKKGAAGTQPAETAPEAESKAKPKKAKRSGGGGGRKSKKEKATLSMTGAVVANSDHVPSEDRKNRDVDVEMEVEEGEEYGGSAVPLLRRDDDDDVDNEGDDAERSASATGQRPLPSQAQVTTGAVANSTSTSGWGNPFNWWRTSTSTPTPSGGGRGASPASDKMDTD